MEYKVVIKTPAPVCIIVEIGGKEYRLAKAKMGEVRKFEDKLFAAQGGKGPSMAPIMDFLIGSGLPEDVVNDFSDDEMNEVLALLMPSKKN